MTSLLSGRHKYLTNKNTKKGQKVRKKLSLRERSHFLPLKTGTALSPQAKAVQHPAGSRFFEMISFFLHSVSANLMVAKKRANARKTPEIVRIRGFEAMISFSASQYVSRRRKRYRFQIRKALPNTCLFQARYTALVRFIHGINCPSAMFFYQQLISYITGMHPYFVI